MPKFRIEIEIDYVKVGCNSEPRILHVSESETGARNLTKYLRSFFGVGAVTLWKDISTQKYKLIKL